MARDVVRPIVKGNVLDSINARAKADPPKKGTTLCSTKLTFQREIVEPPSRNELNGAIINCLSRKKTLIYLDCQDSFKGVKEALTKAGIGLDEKGD